MKKKTHFFLIQSWVLENCLQQAELGFHAHLAFGLFDELANRKYFNSFLSQLIFARAVIRFCQIIQAQNLTYIEQHKILRRFLGF